MPLHLSKIVRRHITRVNEHVHGCYHELVANSTLPIWGHLKIVQCNAGTYTLLFISTHLCIDLCFSIVILLTYVSKLSVHIPISSLFIRHTRRKIHKFFCKTCKRIIHTRLRSCIFICMYINTQSR